MDFLFAGDSMLIVFALGTDDMHAKLGVSITDPRFVRLTSAWFERYVWNARGKPWPGVGTYGQVGHSVIV